MQIEWTDPALDDLTSIHNYIARDSAYYAKRFIAQIFEATDRLLDYPQMGRRVPEAGRDDIRELIFERYRIIYLLETNKALVLAVVHGSRDLSGNDTKPWE